PSDDLVGPLPPLARGQGQLQARRDVAEGVDRRVVERVGDPDVNRLLPGGRHPGTLASGSTTTWPVAADRIAASAISTAARPSFPVISGSRPARRASMKPCTWRAVRWM